MYYFLISPSNKKRDDSNSENQKKKKTKQDSKFPATDGVNLEYFLTELSDDDSTSW